MEKVLPQVTSYAKVPCTTPQLILGVFRCRSTSTAGLRKLNNAVKPLCDDEVFSSLDGKQQMNIIAVFRNCLDCGTENRDVPHQRRIAVRRDTEIQNCGVLRDAETCPTCRVECW
jgi:hypothetical protein